jgi:hypothetical protein
LGFGEVACDGSFPFGPVLAADNDGQFTVVHFGVPFGGGGGWFPQRIGSWGFLWVPELLTQEVSNLPGTSCLTSR